MYSYGSPHMAAQKQDDQHERTFSSYVRIRDVVLKTYLGRWTIGRSGESGSGISVLPARYDDNGDDDAINDKMTVICHYYAINDKMTVICHYYAINDKMTVICHYYAINDKMTVICHYYAIYDKMTVICHYYAINDKMTVICHYYAINDKMTVICHYYAINDKMTVICHYYAINDKMTVICHLFSNKITNNGYHAMLCCLYLYEYKDFKLNRNTSHELKLKSGSWFRLNVQPANRRINPTVYEWTEIHLWGFSVSAKMPLSEFSYFFFLYYIQPTSVTLFYFSLFLALCDFQFSKKSRTLWKSHS